MLLHRLASGQQVWIRPISPEDAFGLQDGLRHLSAETIQRRFLGAKPRFTAAELRYLTQVDGVDHIALVAISVDAMGARPPAGERVERPAGGHPSGRLVAVA